MCIDKTKAIFLQDALEILDKTAPDYVDHELYTPYLIKNKDPSQERVLRFIGNVVIPGKHVVQILLDH